MSASPNTIAYLWRILDATTTGSPSDIPENEILLLYRILEALENADKLTSDLDAGDNDITNINNLDADTITTGELTVIE